MTYDEFRRVEAWLYSIPRVQLAIENLMMELEKLDTRAASPPSWMSNPNATAVSGGGSMDSCQAKYMEFMDEYGLRRREVELAILERRQQLECFERVLDMLRTENGQLAQLVRKKYIEKIKPDVTIYETILFVGHSKFYEMRRYTVEAFFECLPGQFNERRKRGQKSA